MTRMNDASPANSGAGTPIETPSLRDPMTRRSLLALSATLGTATLAPRIYAAPASATGSFPVRTRQLTINGASFRVIEQGSGPAVLFCHGFPDLAETWRSQMRAVAEAGYHAIALDMRGYGDSYAPREIALYNGLLIAGDLVGVLDALAISSATIVGHDWGADSAQRAAVMRPDRFHSLVSLSIPFAPRGEMSGFDQLRKAGLGDRYYVFDMMKPDAEARFAPAAQTIPSIYYWLSASPAPDLGWSVDDPARHMLRASPVTVPGWADEAYVRQAIATFQRTGFRGGLNYYHAAQPTFDLTPGLKGQTIRQPSLYLYGARDGLNATFHPTPARLDQMQPVWPGLTKVVRLENTGHWVQHEAADRVNAELVAFLNGLSTHSPRRNNP
ncbi:MAG: alpha/beta hydrolase [Sphingopyxis sp.]|nr:alpha/beta hydrolase [Sphingopyxis sp.]